jgi:hypothetical protein
MLRLPMLLLLALATACASARPASHASVGDAPPTAKVPSKADAEQLFREARWHEAALAYEAIVLAEPTNAGAWMRLGHCRYSDGNDAGALAAWTRVTELGKAPVAQYNVACIHARAHRREQALAALEKAVTIGFNDVATMQSDADLTVLRGDAEFEALVARAKQAPVPPTEARGFDFWLGEWSVTDTAGRPAGTSKIESILNGFVILESWTGASGSSGKSFNTYDPLTQRWRQHWVDDRGTVVDYTDGTLENGRLTLVAKTRAADGSMSLQRMSFFDQAPGRVRQLGEVSSDGGATWTTSFDLVYTRKS